MSIIQMTVDCASKPVGNARLVSSIATIERALNADVTIDQLKAIFPDLQKYPNSQITGFMGMAQDIQSGRTKVPSTSNFMPSNDSVEVNGA